jgi:hypothetical protein
MPATLLILLLGTRGLLGLLFCPHCFTLISILQLITLHFVIETEQL